MGVAPRWESVDLRVWDEDYGRSWPLYPWVSVRLDHRADISIDRLSISLSDSHAQLQRLRRHKTTPVPITLEVNGVFWSGLVSSMTQTSDGDVRIEVSQDTKHAHRLLARARVMAAVDGGTTQTRGGVATITAGLMADAAQRTGLPVYLQAEADGDPVDLEVRAEDTVADVVGEALAASSTFLDMRVLLPGQELPAGGDITRVKGAVEGPWEENRLAGGVWPHAATDTRLKRQSVAPTITPTPPLSWVGTGTVNERGVKVEETRGVCWVPFATNPADGYFTTRETAGVRVTTAAQLQAERRTGWAEHITYWAAGTFGKNGDTVLLDEAAEAGLLAKTNGTQFRDAAEALAYIGAGAAYAWHDGTRWVLANTTDFNAEHKKRNPTGQPKQTPGVLVRLHQGRDRREVVFSSTRGGGLEKWETTTKTPEAAMLHASAQLDAATLQALKAGTLTATTQVGQLAPGAATTLIGSRGGVPETVESVDVSAQPLVTVAGTEVSQSRIGGRVNVDEAGPFFYREMNVSVTSSANPAAVLGREWAKAQGGATIQLTPGHGVNTVFGDDVTVDGRTILGWKPGDRVSFVDGETRISEIVAGFVLEARWDAELSVVPVLGRADNGVMDGLMKRVRGAESAAGRALTQSTRRADVSDVDAVVETNRAVEELVSNTEAVLSALSDTDDASGLLPQLVAVNEELQRLGQEPQPSLMLAFVSLSTALFQAQEQINAQQAVINAQQEQINAAQDSQLGILINAQKSFEERRVDLITLSRAELPWESDYVSVSWSDTGGAIIRAINSKRSHMVATLREGDAVSTVVDTVPTRTGSTSLTLASPEQLSESGVIGLVLRPVPGAEKRITRTIPPMTPRTRGWEQVAEIVVPEGVSGAVASLRVVSLDTGKGDTLGVRIRVGDNVLLSQTQGSSGGAFGGGRNTLFTAGNVRVSGGQKVIYESQNSSTVQARRAISSGQALLAYVE